MADIDLSIIIPVYNEEKTIEEIIRRVEAVDFGPVKKEIIIVNDGSTDRTPSILKKYESKYKIRHHTVNSGKGAAVRTGFKEAAGQFMIVQDADLEYDPQDIKKILEFAKSNGAPAVFGSRRLGLAKKKNAKAGWSYYLGGVFLSWLVNILYGTKLTDEPTCYKMVRRDALERVDLQAKGFEFCPEITAKIAKLKMPIFEVPISYKPRSKQEGKKIKIKDGLIAIWTLIKYRF